MYWMIVERYENWLIDDSNGFSYFGIPDRKLKLASEVKTGDQLIVYVSSGISAFSDVREVVVDGPVRIASMHNYDEPFSWCIQTKSLVRLEKENWISVKDYLERLSFTKGKKKWANMMLNSLRKLSESDASLIIEEFESRSSS